MPRRPSTLHEVPANRKNHQKQSQELSFAQQTEARSCRGRRPIASVPGEGLWAMSVPEKLVELPIQEGSSVERLELRL